MKGGNLIKRKTKTTIFAILFGVIFFILLIIITQAIQTYYLLLDVNIILAYSFLVFAVLIFLYAVIYPIIKFLLLPKAPVLPRKADYQTDPAKRQIVLDFLKNNQTLRLQLQKQDKTILFDESTTDEEIEECFSLLNQESEKTIRSNASRVFISTTISQNGSLDALFMLVHMTKMVWHVATIYHQRPGIGKLARIYLNVLGTLFLTRELEDLELLDEQLEPILSMVFGSFFSSMVPGVQTATNIVLNSAIQGSANAYLTLRVGLMAEEFILNEDREDKRQIRRSASIKALPMLGTVVNDNRKIIQSTIVKLAKRIGKNTYLKSRDWTSGLFKKDQ